MKNLLDSVLEVVAISALGFIAGFLIFGVAFKAHGHKEARRVEVVRPVPVKTPVVVKTEPVVINSEKAGVLTLSKKNTISFRGVVTDQSVAVAESEILEISNKLNDKDTIYLVLDTPGGEVMAGTSFIDFLRALPQRVKPVVIFAASMGFQITEHLDERIITPNGTLMSHRATAGVQGQIPGELFVELNHFMRLMDRLDLNDATRMGLTLEQYRNKTHDEYWVSGADAVADKAADKVEYIRCASDLSGTEKVAVPTIFGTVNVTFSKCPAITGPLAIELGGLKFRTELDREEYLQYQNMLFNNREAFVKKYIVTNEFNKIQPK